MPGVCSQQQVLLLFASGLMVPRALLARELMWFTGTCSATLLAAVQLVVMAVHAATTSLQGEMTAARVAASLGLEGAALSLSQFMQTTLLPVFTGWGVRWAGIARVSCISGTSMQC